MACRYGGEEFCLLLPRTSAAAASRKVNALLKQWRTSAFTHESVSLAGNTFSAGIADSTQAPESPQALLKAADDCVLEAKRLGRNRVLVFDQTEQEEASDV